MKKYNFIFLLFAIISSDCIAQNNSGYTLFIQRDTAIQWAAQSNKVINLTPKVQAYSLKKWYTDKIMKEGVTAYRETKEGDAVTPYQFSMSSLQKQDWLTGLNAEPGPRRTFKEWYFVDGTKPANDYERLRYRAGIKFSKDSCCGCEEADAFRTKQILNYKHGKFSIYNIFISPLCARQTMAPPYEWYPLCNVAYNDNAERKFPGLSKDVVLLNTDEVDYEFGNENDPSYDSVLTTYHGDIGSLIYRDILIGNIKPVEVDNGKPISPKKFLTWHMPADTVAVYSVDDPSKMTGYRIVQSERSSRDLSRLRIKQDLYFDFRYERLYSVIRSVIILLPVRLMDGTIRGYLTFCKIY